MRRSAAFALLLLLASCASDIGLVKRSEMETLKLELAAARNDLAELKKSLAEVKKSTPGEESFAALRESQASLYLQVTQLLRDVQVLSGRFDENKFFIDKFLKDSASELEIMKSKTAALSSQIDKSGLQGLKQRLDSIESELLRISSLLVAAGNIPPSQTAAAPDKAYEDALKAFNEKRYDESRKMFESFLKNYPDHALAGNSRFWIGDIYFSQKKYDDAILSYQEVIEKHTGNPKVPAALLKQAFAFLEMNDPKAARGILKEIIEKYPKSEQADAAKKKLESLK